MPARRFDYVPIEVSNFSFPSEVARQTKPCLPDQNGCHALRDISKPSTGEGSPRLCVSNSYGSFETCYRGAERWPSGPIDNNFLGLPNVDRSFPSLAEKLCSIASDGSNLPLERRTNVALSRIDSGRFSYSSEQSLSPPPYSPAQRNLSVPFDRNSEDNLDQKSFKYERIGGMSSLQRQHSGGSVTDRMFFGDVTCPTSPHLSFNPSNSAAFDALYSQTSIPTSSKETESSTPKSFARQTEQSYNMQLTLALRVTAEAALTDECRLVGHHFQEISCSADRKSVLSTSYRFWVNGSLGYNDFIHDGFYQIYGMNPQVWAMCNYADEVSRMPSLQSLRALDPAETTVDVVIIDRNKDSQLRELESNALCLAYEATNTLNLIELLAERVCGLLGGTASSEHGGMIDRWETSSSGLKDRLSSVVLPLGNLSVGLCRHRAILFKTLADSVNLPCRIARGCKYCGLNYGASCMVLCGLNREYNVDLFSKPGFLAAPDCFWAMHSSTTSIFSPFHSPEQSSHLSQIDSRTNGSSSGALSVDLSHWHCREERKKMEKEPTEESHSGGVQMTFSDPSPGAEVWAVMKVSEQRACNVLNEKFKSSTGNRKGFANVLSSGNMSFITEVNGDCMNTGVESSKSNEKLESPQPDTSQDEKQEQEMPSNFTANIPLAQQQVSMWSMEPSRRGPTESSWEAEGIQTAGKVEVEKGHSVQDWEIAWEDIAVKERLGAGTFGTVHRADWHGSDVAVKILVEQDMFEERLNEFMREVAILKRLRHPNVVLFMGVVTKRPNLSIVTEYLPRGSLFRLLHRSAAKEYLDERKRIRMAFDVAKGMNYLHRSNPPIVHRDLKSPNLLVDKNWNVKVCDFGLSRFKGNTFLSSRSGAGTPEWMAPEVLRDEQSNEKSDVYSFGVVLWEIVTLQQPWSGLSPAQVVGAVGFQNRRLQIPKDLNPTIAAVIESCWSNDQRQRPSFAGIMTMLKEFQKPTAVNSFQALYGLNNAT